MQSKESIDYYEILHVSPIADEETIRRAYRTMASRFHPDNPLTGNVEGFLLLQQAFQVLSDHSSRAEYNAIRASRDEKPLPIFELKSFVLSVDAEMNRRLAILSLLYSRRRTEEERPGISVLELVKRLAILREHLNFTLWYLRSKEYVKLELNSEYTLTALGADYVEANYSQTRTSACC